LKKTDAGIHVAAGPFLLGPDVLRNIQERKLHQEEKQHEKLGKFIFEPLKPGLPQYENLSASTIECHAIEKMGAVVQANY
jgi:hypothetical protein